jgi:ABC-type antimicrobial peptide transport system permease subunit
LLAAMTGTAALVGALLVGDSVRFSLRGMALERLGNIELALPGGERFFRAALARRLADQPDFKGLDAASVLLAEGICIADTSGIPASRVQVAGISADFWRLSPGPPPSHPARGEALLNQKLADAIGAHPGDTVRLRFFKPGVISRDAPMGSRDDSTATLRVKVSAIIPNTGFGRFGLQASQAVPLNAFVALEDLQEKLGQKGRANLLLVSKTNGFTGDPPSKAAAALRAAWSLDDAQLRLRTDADLKFSEVSTPRVFLDPPLADRLLADGGQGVLTYFVNALRCNGRETPYSMLCAATPPLIQESLRDDEIVLNAWAADDLGATPGSNIEIEYFVLGQQRKLETRRANFTVKGIVPIEGLHADKTLMPDFPGIADVDTTHDWDSSIPIDMKKIRDKDELYWKNHRGTPKAFITLKRGQALWGNRYGNTTAARFPSGRSAETAQRDLAARLRDNVDPGRLGLSFVPVKALAIKAVEQAVDFGGLFLGFSFFLIFSALLLMALMFKFSVEDRAEETGALLAVGFSPRHLRALLWSEGAILSVAGSVLGAAAGVCYARFLLDNLTRRWQAAVGAASLRFHAEPESLALGCVTGTAIALLVIFLVLRKQARQPVTDLLAGRLSPAPKSAKREWLGKAAGGIAIAAALLLLGTAQSGPGNAGLFFGAGALLLFGLLALQRSLLFAPKSASTTTATRSLLALGLRGTSLQGGRSLATVALLACGVFLIVAVGASRLDARVDAGRKESGTGGFALSAESTIPVFEDLNTASGREKAGVSDAALKDATVRAFRVKNGDEASCLNLNRAQRPKILGASDSFLQRGGFSFATQIKSPLTGWDLLKNRAAADSREPIPAVCDHQSLTWALGLKVGDELGIMDDFGRPHQLKFVATLANSILQGCIIISEEDFTRLHPSESGYRHFLIDAPANETARVATRLATALANEGFQSASAEQRLAEFNAVQNTYLNTFQLLGGLGLLLGSLGLGIVALRNMLERRRELAVLRAVGFSRRQIGWLILSEHACLLALGLSTGLLAALAAVLPVMRASDQPPDWAALARALLAVLACGGVSALFSTVWALRGDMLNALKNN